MRSGLKSGYKSDNFAGIGVNGCLGLSSRYKNRKNILLSDGFLGYSSGTYINGLFSDGMGLQKPNSEANLSEIYKYGIPMGGAGVKWDSPKGYIDNSASGIKRLFIKDADLTKGADVNQDPNFDDASKWTITGGPNVTVNDAGSPGTLNFNGLQSANQGVTQNCLTPGTFYKIMLTRSRYTAGQVYTQTGTGYNYFSNNITLYKLAASATFGIKSNASPYIADLAWTSCTIEPLTLSELITTAELNHSDVTGVIPMNANTSGVYGMILNLDSYINPQNFIFAGADGGNVLLMGKYINGTFTVLINSNSANYSAGYTNTFGDLIVSKKGNIYTVYLNIRGVLYQVGTPQTVNDSSIVNNTRHGALLTPYSINHAPSKIIFAKNLFGKEGMFV